MLCEPEPCGGLGGELAVTDAAAGYIDNAIIGDQVRLRFDSAFNDVFPDRAEFVYPSAPKGPPPEKRIDYREISTYMEFATADNFSSFVEIPVRFLDPAVNLNTGGLGDVNAGFKYAMCSSACGYLTFQLRIYTPTGIPIFGLGTGHVSIEPSLLIYRKINNCLSFQGEFRDWQPIAGSKSAGNVIRYGAGFGYDLRQPCPSCERGPRITAVAELVGWTVLHGQKSSDGLAQDASGDTIVNLKLGPRLTCGHNSFYLGWGHAITGDAWYRDMMRLEYLRTF